MSIEVRNGQIEDIDALLELDNKVFDKAWMVPKSVFVKSLQKNNQIYRVFEEDEQIIGYYCCYPLNEKAFHKLMVGELELKYIAENTLAYGNEIPVWAYIDSVVVDVDLERAKRAELSKQIAKDVPNFIIKLLNEGVDIKEVGSMVVTRAGRYFAKNMGLSKIVTIEKESKTFTVYRRNMKELNTIYGFDAKKIRLGNGL